MPEWISPSDPELDAQIEAARERGRIADASEPRATSARYNRRTKRIEVELKDGRMIAFPAENAQGLQGATAEQLAAVEVEGDGYALRWEALDADLTVPGVLAGHLGSRQWMSELGRAGGKARSPAKAIAARINGRRGGRPRKSDGVISEPSPKGRATRRGAGTRS
ncbi:DUF2442 domain-containing protein [soil metagenome]